MGAFLTYALDDNGILVHVDGVPKGAKCNCHCPHCQSMLYAKNGGQERTHHFAHAKGHECENAYESALHLLAKEILLETGHIMLPSSTSVVSLSQVYAEKYDEQYHIRPDIEGVLENGERLLIEFYVSHKVDYNKRKIIIDNHLKCIEIDINYQPLDKSELKEFLLNSSEDRRWITSTPTPATGEVSSSYGRNPIYDKVRDVLKDVYEEKTLIIYPHQHSFRHPNTGYDLKRFGYDVCEVNTQYRGFKSDLLLYRSQRTNKDYISINIRGRRRPYGYKRPKELRVIDIIIRNDSDKDLKLKWGGGQLKDTSWDIIVEYAGFKVQ
jgi:hypothetical protein